MFLIGLNIGFENDRHLIGETVVLFDVSIETIVTDVDDAVLVPFDVDAAFGSIVEFGVFDLRWKLKPRQSSCGELPENIRILNGKTIQALILVEVLNMIR